MAKEVDNNGGWTKTVVRNGQVYETVNTDAFKEAGYDVPNDSKGRPLHTHTSVGENSRQEYHRDWFGNEYIGNTQVDHYEQGLFGRIAYDKNGNRLN